MTTGTSISYPAIHYQVFIKYVVSCFIVSVCVESVLEESLLC